MLFPPILTAQTSNLKPYYFPFKKLKKAKVYQFEVENQPELTQYWRIQTFEKNGKQFLQTETYKYDFQLMESTIEQLDDMGSKMRVFLLRNQKGRMDTVSLVDRDVFRWKQEEKESIRWSMLTNNDKNETLFIAKQRTYLKDCQTPAYKGKNLAAICFRDALHSVNSDTYEEVFAFTQISYYAQKVGLVGFDRSFEFEEEKNANYRLVKVWKEKKWKKWMLKK